MATGGQKDALVPDEEPFEIIEGPEGANPFEVDQKAATGEEANQE